MKTLLFLCFLFVASPRFCFGDDIEVVFSGHGTPTSHFQLQIINKTTNLGYQATRWQEFDSDMVHDVNSDTFTEYAEKANYEVDVKRMVNPLNGVFQGIFHNHRGSWEILDRSTRDIYDSQGNYIEKQTKLDFERTQFGNKPNNIQGVWLGTTRTLLKTKLTSNAQNKSGSAGQFTDTFERTLGGNLVEKVVADFTFGYNSNDWAFNLLRTGVCIQVAYQKYDLFITSPCPLGSDTVSVGNPADLNENGRPSALIDWVYSVTSIFDFIDHINNHPSKYTSLINIFPFDPSELQPPPGPSV